MEDDDEDDNAMFGGWDPGVFKDEIEEEMKVALEAYTLPASEERKMSQPKREGG